MKAGRFTFFVATISLKKQKLPEYSRQAEEQLKLFFATDSAYLTLWTLGSIVKVKNFP